MHACFVLNHACNFTVGNVPLNAATASTCDISSLLRFTFYKPVHFIHDESDFPLDSTEERGRFLVCQTFSVTL